ncbi:uncharacterized protein ColSpa_08360 [Colletotrichum spaethianum]|uniref:Uncharacterized protein n=1 Tax=Colletotrichum spaethianum TaxID=700344 RepID=A0AA37UIK8_9PEZI|nr:uncharacterized protein ColSpa_08360 [Colletotrichum spaethianum]GKT48179.1 hypothetical protein ColSpa_08360 [Colletotrichum spaethianum]
MDAAEELPYVRFVAFIRSFSNASDDEVSLRWRFGQLRLSRLHWAVRIFQPAAATRRKFPNGLFYEEQFWQISDFLKEFGAPLLFVFAALSLILSAMQVVLAVKSGYNEGGWRVVSEVSAWFAAMVIVAVVIIFVGIVLIGLGVWLWQFQFGYRSWRRSRAADEQNVGGFRNG